MFDTDLINSTPPPLTQSTSHDGQTDSSRGGTPATPSWTLSATALAASGTSSPLPPPLLPPQPGSAESYELLSPKSQHSAFHTTVTRLCVVEPDFNDDTFPTFTTRLPMAVDAGTLQFPSASGMNGNLPTISTRQTSTSPRGNQPSGLTAALRNQPSPPIDTPKMEPPKTSLTVPDTDAPRLDNGSRPIAMKGRPGQNQNRRESTAQGQSIAQSMGMSWGGLSVGSWVRDDMIMSGTSPFAFHQSPSYHSSSYIPKFEENYMKDFTCCGKLWKDMHDLLHHYESTHANQEPIEDQSTAQPQMPDQRAAVASNTRAQIQHEAQQRAALEPVTGAVQPVTSVREPAYNATLETIPDMDAVEDMEMDDFDGNDESTPPSNAFAPMSNRASPQTQYAATAAGSSQVPQLSTNFMQSHQTYRNSTPSTPTINRNVNVNNLPAINSNPLQQFQDYHNPAMFRGTPDSSAPGTPRGELDESLMAGMDDMSMNNGFGMNGFNNSNNFGFENSNDMIDLCIDEPAKRLFQQSQGSNSQQAIHQRLGAGQYGPNSEIAKRIREQQVKAGLPDTMSNLLPNEEPKPFRCPVIGCDKSYRNANGLKYHKTHGHQNQRLQDNGDGTFSILDPENNQPYPGMVGMEKEKPYKCDVCHKRYKNLNGLKYHKTHSPPCNPELAQQRLEQRQAALAQHQAQQQAQNANASADSGASMVNTGGLGMNMNFQ